MIEIKRRKPTEPPLTALAAIPQATQESPAELNQDRRRMDEAALFLYRMYEPPPMEAEQKYWEALIDDLARASAAFGNDPYFNGLLIRVYNKLEAEDKQRRGGRLTTPPRLRKSATGGQQPAGVDISPSIKKMAEGGKPIEAGNEAREGDTKVLKK